MEQTLRRTSLSVWMRCALFAALTALLSQIVIPIGPVPINLATLSVILSGGLLGAKYGLLSQVVYVLLGLAGAPVFNTMQGGPGVLLGPTGGYIIGYLVLAFLVGWCCDRFGRAVPVIASSMVLGTLVLYAFGTAWFLISTGNGLWASLTLCVFPFLPGDAAKIAAACVLVRRLHPVLTGPSGGAIMKKNRQRSTPMDTVFSGRRPEDALSYFEQLSRIPRESGNEKEAAGFVAGFADEHGLWNRTDGLYNVYVKKPGSPGCGHLPPILLQGHLDMVCIAAPGVDHDFGKDPIRLEAEGDILTARGTTLGADNGVAVALMMALLARTDLRHPPLECLFTTQEETGLSGAAAADLSCFGAKRLLNLDGGPEGKLIAGSAGGLRLRLFRGAARSPAAGQALSLRVSGLLGGHSGADIHRVHGNALKIMARLLHALYEAQPFRLASFTGGSKDNAIPQECEALLCLTGTIAEAEEILERQMSAIKKELAGTEPGLSLEIKAAQAGDALDEEESRRLVRLLFLLPNGVEAYNSAIPDAVETSLNVAIVELAADGACVTCSLRSASPSQMEHLQNRLLLLCELLGFQAESGSAYPGWSFAPESPLRELCARVFRETTGLPVETELIHAGLECGLFKEKVPDMDIVSMGPTVTAMHSPDEKLDLGSFARMYDFLVALLERMANE